MINRIYYITAVIFMVSVSFAQQPSWSWVNKIGNNNDETSFSVCSDANNNAIVIGATKSTYFTMGAFTYTNKGLSDILIAKYDPLGNLMWVKCFGGTKDDYGYDITTDANNNIFITGYFFSPTLTIGSNTLINTTSSGFVGDFFVVKLDPNGNVIWAKSQGGSQSNDFSMSLDIDNGGNVFITGGFYGPQLIVGTTTLTSTSCSLFLIKYDNNGNFQWAKQSYGSVCYGQSLVLDNSGNCYVAGMLTGQSTVIGTTTVSNSGQSNSMEIFVSKFDQNGSPLWTKIFYGSHDDVVNNINSDSFGNIYMVGEYKSLNLVIGTNTIVNPYIKSDYLIKLDPNGDLVWFKQGSGGAMSKTVELDNSGNVFVSGSYDLNTYSVSNFTITYNSAENKRLYIAKYGSDGTPLWLFDSQGVNNQSTKAIAVTPSNDLIYTGCFYNGGSFGDSIFVDIGNGADIFLAKLSDLFVGIKNSELQDEDIRIFPNPVNDKMKIIGNYLNEKLRKIEIQNVVGQKVYELGEADKSEVDLGYLPKGIYFVSLEFAGSRKRSYKVIKE